MQNLTEAFVRGLKTILARQPDMTVASLAELSGVSKSNLHKLLARTGHSPRLTTLEAIAQGLQMSVSQILALGDADRDDQDLEIFLIIKSLRQSDKTIAYEFLKYLEQKRQN